MFNEAGATAAAAVLSAFVALMVVVITKEQKVSEFRQAWIDALRADIAEAISSMAALTIIMHNYEDEHVDSFVTSYEKSTAALARIDLRLNLTEIPHQKLDKCLREAESLLQNLSPQSGQEVVTEWELIRNNLVAISRPLLKAEWDRVRNGETVYKIAKYGLACFLVSALLGGLIYEVIANCNKAGAAKAEATISTATTAPGSRVLMK